MECIDFLDFLNEDIHQGKVACEATTSGCVCLDIPSHAQTCLDVLRVPLSSLGGIARLNVIQNEKLTDFFK